MCSYNHYLNSRKCFVDKTIYLSESGWTSNNIVTCANALSYWKNSDYPSLLLEIETAVEWQLKKDEYVNCKTGS